jgi:hypothetical protein
MKKEVGLVIAVLFFMSLTAITGVYAIGNDEIVTISKKEVDITGDGQKEFIKLKAVPYEEKNEYFKEIYLEVFAPNGSRYTFPLQNGTKAAFQLADLNHDGVKDVFVTVLDGEVNGNTNYSLFSLKDFKKEDLPIPEPLLMESRLLNGFKAEIKIKDTGNSYRFDLKDRKKYYKKMGLYTNGRLQEPTELMVDSFNSLKPFTDQNKRKGLKGIQRVSGIADADTIAYVESTWMFENGKWVLKDVEVKGEEY